MTHFCLHGTLHDVFFSLVTLVPDPDGTFLGLQEIRLQVLPAQSGEFLWAALVAKSKRSRITLTSITCLPESMVLPDEKQPFIRNPELRSGN